MKGTAPQAVWPVPADNVQPATVAPATKTISRITLALLDEYSSDERSRGYNPYETASSGRLADIWRRKPKRD